MQASISLGVAHPGMTGTPWARHQSTTSMLVPGLTMALAPAATACSACCAVNTVPAQTKASGAAAQASRIASAAAGVRKVISTAGSPPSHRARASPAAGAARLILTTGTMPTARNTSIIAMPPPPFSAAYAS